MPAAVGRRHEREIGVQNQRTDAQNDVRFPSASDRNLESIWTGATPSGSSESCRADRWIPRIFPFGAPCSNLPPIFLTWGPMFKSSADLSNLEPHVQIFCRSFRLRVPCSNLPRIFPT